MATRAHTNLEWIEAESSVTVFRSPIINLELPLQALNFQLLWGTGVTGIFEWQADIFPSEWESLDNCGPVRVEANGTEGSSIVSLAGLWLTMGRVRFEWTPDSGGSTGTIDAAIRIVPT